MGRIADAVRSFGGAQDDIMIGLLLVLLIMMPHLGRKCRDGADC
jgi:hypothetical protein